MTSRFSAAVNRTRRLPSRRPSRFFQQPGFEHDLSDELLQSDVCLPRSSGSTNSAPGPLSDTACRCSRRRASLRARSESSLPLKTVGGSSAGSPKRPSRVCLPCPSGPSSRGSEVSLIVAASTVQKGLTLYTFWFLFRLRHCDRDRTVQASHHLVSRDPLVLLRIYGIRTGRLHLLLENSLKQAGIWLREPRQASL